MAGVAPAGNSPGGRTAGSRGATSTAAVAPELLAAVVPATLRSRTPSPPVPPNGNAVFTFL